MKIEKKEKGQEYNIFLFVFFLFTTSFRTRKLLSKEKNIMKNDFLIFHYKKNKI